MELNRGNYSMIQSLKKTRIVSSCSLMQNVAGTGWKIDAWLTQANPVSFRSLSKGEQA